MLKTISVFFILLYFTPCEAQDTTYVKGDSLVIYKDSLGIFNDTLSASDTTGLLSNKKNITKTDSLAPLFTAPLTDNSYIIASKEIQFSNYRYTEDLLEIYSFYYNQVLGSIGNNNANYSMGTYKIGYLQNGVPISNTGPDLNLVQSENVDSVEIIPAPRSNLYTYGENFAAINFITKDQLWIRPYTRIKYYQGADGEALFDGIFNSVLYKKLYGYLDATNRKLDQGYANTSFNSWQVTARLRYLFSNELNMTTSYSYAKLYKGLNGGVNVDSTGLNNNDLIFNSLQAPVNYYQQDRDQKLHNYDVKFLAKPFKNLFTDVSFYYHFYQDNLNNLYDISGSDNDVVDKTKMTGLMFRGYYDIKKYFNINLNFQYAKEDWESTRNLGKGSRDIMNLSSVIDLKVSDFIEPSIFYRYSQSNGTNISELFPSSYNYVTTNNLSCLGGDVKITPLEGILIYAGFSNSKLLTHQTLNTLQLTASCQIEKLYLRGEFVNREYGSISNYALSGTLNFRIGSFLLESTNIYDKYNVYNFREGVYFFDSLFVPNLLLKAGISMNIIGPRTYYNSNLRSDISLNTDYTFNFTLAGEIRKSATIYITFENILDRQYYVVPFYPMQGRNLRFGVAWELLN